MHPRLTGKIVNEKFAWRNDHQKLEAWQAAEGDILICLPRFAVSEKPYLQSESVTFKFSDMPPRNLDVTRSQSSMNIENLTSIPVGGSITLINYSHTQLPTECNTSSAKDRGWAWVVCGGSFFVMFMVYGIHTSFGVLLVVLLDHFNANKASTGK